MMILLAFLIAVVAISLMMTVLVVSTRPLRALDDPIFGARPAGGVATRRNRPRGTEFERAPPPRDAIHAPRSPERAIPSLPLPAPVISTAPELTGSRVVSRPHAMATPRPAPRGSEHINPNTWGLVRAEVGPLKAARDHIRSQPR